MYELNTQSAREAEKISNYLTDTGKYKGIFTRAEKLVSSKKGTHGIGFTFKNNDNRTTRFDIWTTDKEGSQLVGFKALMAIMTCLRLRNIKPSSGKVDRWNNETRANEIVDAEVFADLLNKPIGVLFRSTEYEKMKDAVKTGETAWRLELFQVFDSATEMVASEILDKKTKPEMLPVLLAQLSDRPLKKKSSQQSIQHQSGLSEIDLDEDIPF
jgi:hypothetical protein